MKISFDLDDTIIPGNKKFETEEQNFIHKIFGVEKIRKETINLFKELKLNNHNVGIYTTSYRSKFKIKLTFLLNGFSVDFIVNQKQNLEALEKSNIKPSKLPPLFQIDIHSDDSKGVQQEGEKYNFQTIIIDEQDLNWTKTILKQISYCP